MKRLTKFVAYFDLRDACGEAGCPVCTLLVKFSLRTMDQFMHERVTDPGCREELLASRGFCNWHAWMLPKLRHSASGTAVIHEHLLQKELKALGELRRAHRVQPRWRDLLRRLVGSGRKPGAGRGRRKRAACQVCTGARISDEIYLKTCVEFITEVEFRRSFEQSAGLCLPHLYLAASMEPTHPNLPQLLELQTGKIEAVRADLSVFIRKQDYRFMDEPVGKEGSAWVRSIELLTGKPGVFGPDRPRIPLTPELRGTASALLHSEETASEDRDALQRENERLRFENEKLRRRIDEISKLWSEESSRAASLHFQVFELAKAKQILEFNLAGAQGEGKGWEGVVSRLREEIAALQEELAQFKERSSAE
ncbi:MAG: DUF6062 family protein [Candidatus Methylomirabilales bacterium]